MGPTQAPDTPVLSSGSRPGVDAEDPEGPSYPHLSVLVLRHALAQCPEGREGQPLQRPPPWPPASFPVQHMWGMEGHSGAVARAPGLPRLTCVAVGTVRRGGGQGKPTAGSPWSEGPVAGAAVTLSARLGPSGVRRAEEGCWGWETGRGGVSGTAGPTPSQEPVPLRPAT